jgi:GTP-binding protein HflX
VRAGFHETTERPEVAVLFGAVAGRDPAPLSELAGLAEAADVGVAARVTQRLERPVAATYLGSGKVGELREVVERTGADLAIADMDLSPAQARNLTKALGVRVVDRSELIMDIFARRARTAQAQLQVELAQLQYALPRLRGQWSHLDRYRGGGVGTRGPGEKQIETDRRLVQKRIQELKDKLETFERRTRLQIEGRTALRSVALAGLHEHGQVTLFNALTGADLPAVNRLFATLDTRTRRWPIEGLDDVLLSDTVGFVRDLPHHLVALLPRHAEEVIEADLVLHVVDATDEDAPARIEAVAAVLRQIGADGVPSLMVLNKVDLVRDGMHLQALLNSERGAVAVSARTGQGLPELARPRARAPAGQRAPLAPVRAHGAGPPHGAAARAGHRAGERRERERDELPALRRAAPGRPPARLGRGPRPDLQPASPGGGNGAPTAAATAGSGSGNGHRAPALRPLLAQLQHLADAQRRGIADAVEARQLVRQARAAQLALGDARERVALLHHVAVVRAGGRPRPWAPVPRQAPARRDAGGRRDHAAGPPRRSTSSSPSARRGAPAARPPAGLGGGPPGRRHLAARRRQVLDHHDAQAHAGQEQDQQQRLAAVQVRAWPLACGGLTPRAPFASGGRAPPPWLASARRAS